MKFYCFDCGDIFDEDESLVSYERPNSDVPGYISFCCCPSCKSTDMGEACECDCCGEYFNQDDIHNGLCPGCEQELDKDIDNVLDNFIQGRDSKMYDAIIERFIGRIEVR